MPKTKLMQFGHIRRMRDAKFPHEIAVILPGEFFVSQEPMIVYTVLGSCISVCIRDTKLGIGGMNHFMLAAPSGDVSSDSWGASARYGTFAMEVLINEILQRGGMKTRFEVKVFGGGKIFESQNNVGAKNIVWVMEFLEREGLPPIKADVGDVCPRKVYYFTETGRVLLKKLEKVAAKTIADREIQYQAKLKQQEIEETQESDITLF